MRSLWVVFPLLIVVAGCPNPKLLKDQVTTVHLAQKTILAEDIADQAVGTEQLADLSVTMEKLKDQSVTRAKLVDQAVTPEKLGDQSVITPKLADKAVTAAKLHPQAVTYQHQAGEPISLTAGMTMTAIATCPPGLALVGAGFSQGDPYPYQVLSMSLSGVQARVTFRNPGASSNVQAAAIAYCARVGS